MRLLQTELEILDEQMIRAQRELESTENAFHEERQIHLEHESQLEALQETLQHQSAALEKATLEETRLREEVIRMTGNVQGQDAARAAQMDELMAALDAREHEIRALKEKGLEERAAWEDRERELAAANAKMMKELFSMRNAEGGAEAGANVEAQVEAQANTLAETEAEAEAEAIAPNDDEMERLRREAKESREALAHARGALEAHRHSARQAQAKWAMDLAEREAELSTVKERLEFLSGNSEREQRQLRSKFLAMQRSVSEIRAEKNAIQQQKYAIQQQLKVQTDERKRRRASRAPSNAVDRVCLHVGGLLRSMPRLRLALYLYLALLHGMGWLAIFLHE